MAEPSAIPPHITWLLDRIEAEGKTPRLVQTHVSFVVLDGTDVYKFKKPVRFDFIDLSSLDLRRQTCEDEVRLNSRLCAELYHGVVPIRRDGEGYSLDGDGEVADYAVHMRQLSDEGMLDRRIERGDVTADMIGAIAGRMARFHAAADASDRITALGGFGNFAGNWSQNFREVEGASRETIDAATRANVDAFVQRSMTTLKPLMLQREAEGRVRDCHGDLRADAIWIDPADERNICIFDCIDFNERYRLSDTGLDVAFLAMDLEAKGRRDLADLFVGLYCQASGDATLPPLLPLFKSYRAFVRVKVRELFAQQPEAAPAQRDAARAEAAALVRLATSYAEAPGFGGLVMVCGLTGSGKSMLAGALASRMGAAVVSTDVTRKSLAGVEPTRPLPPEAYAAEMSSAVYGSIAARAEELLGQGFGVVLDGTFSQRWQRQAAYETARRLQRPLLVVECRAPDEVVRQRQEARAAQDWKASDATWQVYLDQKATADPFDDVPGGDPLVVDTTLPLEELLSLVLSHLPGALKKT